MFKKIKKNVTRIELDECTTTTVPVHRATTFDDGEAPVKRIKLIPNLSIAVKPVVVPIHEEPPNYAAEYLTMLMAINEKEAVDARQHMLDNAVEEEEEE